MTIPYPTWATAAYKKGQTIKFLRYKKPETITEGTVTGWDTQDRLLVTYALPNGVVVPEASVHISLIIP